MILQVCQTPSGPSQTNDTVPLERSDACDLYLRAINQNVRDIGQHLANLADAVARHKAILTEPK